MPSYKKTFAHNRNHNSGISRAALVIIGAAFLLAALLATLTIRNIHREESLMRTFLLHEGLTLIRSFEAGARTTMMHRMAGGDSLDTLVAETVKEDSVAYIRVVDDKGEVLAAAGDWPSVARPPATEILAAARPFTTRIKGRNIFEIAGPFTPTAPDRGMMMGWRGGRCDIRNSGRLTGRPLVIYLGLNTGDFDRASAVDVRHAMLLGAILFLVGAAGFYFIFLYQNMRVARRTIADMELYTANVIESMPAGLITLDNRGRVVSCNRRAEGITGLDIAELRGRELCGALDLPPLDPQAPPLLEYPHICSRDDREVPVRISTSVLHDRTGQIKGQVIIIRDVREIVEIERKLEQSRRLSALGRMAAGIAHEIRNPLGTLRGFAQLFVGKFSDNSEEQEYARMMVAEVDRLNRTISALLQFARPREPELQQICLNDELARTKRFMTDDFAANGVELRLALPEEKIFFNADADLLQQVLLNLLQNALAACERGGVVELGGGGRSGGTALWVADDGCGMRPEDRERMFDPFFTTKKSGTGLGLAVVHQIVGQQHGRLAVDSAPGQGTRIEIIFPDQQEAA